jgi:hypothetical protein
MLTGSLLLAVKSGALSAVNVQLILGVLLAVSEVLGADPRVKSNGIVSFILLQAQNLLRSKKQG